MKLYYSPEYNLHFGFQTSLENKERLDQTILNLKPIPFEDVVKLGSIPSQDVKFRVETYLNKLSTRFANRTRNCEFCTIPVTSDNCELCGSTSKKIIKLISDIEGDTTFMCETSEKCLNNLLLGIYSVMSSFVETDQKISGFVETDSNGALNHLKETSNCNIFILARPPGHHCDNENPSGFCLVNNIAFATELLLEKKMRVCIVDWDVHHGNGTEKLFYDTNQVLFIDIHRENFYPRTGKTKDIGIGLGKGYTMNFNLPKGSGEKEYIETFNVFIPEIKKFKPDYILVSCGFDAHCNDPIGGMKLQSESYGKFHSLLKKIKVPIVHFLEGGYDGEIIEESVKAILLADQSTN